MDRGFGGEAPNAPVIASPPPEGRGNLWGLLHSVRNFGFG